LAADCLLDLEALRVFACSVAGVSEVGRLDLDWDDSDSGSSTSHLIAEEGIEDASFALVTRRSMLTYAGP
jgi:hypothetical protein